jgi:hypothetical protein
MRARTLRLVLAVLLFVAWTCWLIYLGLATSHPIVLSRPQFLISQLDIVATLERPRGPSTEVTVKEVLWPPSQAALQGKSITIEGLAQSQGFNELGDYILPLTPDGKRYRVTPLPPSPGYGGTTTPRIYPLTRQTRWQLGRIIKPGV